MKNAPRLLLLLLLLIGGLFSYAVADTVPATQPTDEDIAAAKQTWKTILMAVNMGQPEKIAGQCYVADDDAKLLLNDMQAVATSSGKLRGAIRDEFGNAGLAQFGTVLTGASDVDVADVVPDGQSLKIEGAGNDLAYLTKIDGVWKYDILLSRDGDTTAATHQMLTGIKNAQLTLAARIAAHKIKSVDDIKPMLEALSAPDAKNSATQRSTEPTSRAATKLESTDWVDQSAKDSIEQIRDLATEIEDEMGKGQSKNFLSHCDMSTPDAREMTAIMLSSVKMNERFREAIKARFGDAALKQIGNIGKSISSTDEVKILVGKDRAIIIISNDDPMVFVKEDGVWKLELSRMMQGVSIDAIAKIVAQQNERMQHIVDKITGNKINSVAEIKQALLAAQVGYRPIESNGSKQDAATTRQSDGN